jgi:hypothetical protein
MNQSHLFELGLHLSRDLVGWEAPVVGHLLSAAMPIILNEMKEVIWEVEAFSL